MPAWVLFICSRPRHYTEASDRVVTERMWRTLGKLYTELSVPSDHIFVLTADVHMSKNGVQYYDRVCCTNAEQPTSDSTEFAGQV